MIIGRYIFKEIVVTLIAVMFVLLLIFLSNRFVSFLADASSGALSGDVILILLSLKASSSMAIMLPLGLFISVLLAFSRLYKDNEMVALAACGVSVRKIYKTVFVIAMFGALLVAAVSFYVAPWAEEQSYRIQDEEKATTQLGGISEGRFTESNTADGVFYAAEFSADGQTMYEVFAQSKRDDELIVLSSASAYQTVNEQTGDRFIVMVNGYRYEGVPGSPNFRRIKFEKHAVRIDEQAIVESYRKHKAKPTSELIGSTDIGDIAELQWRISMPLSVILLALLAVPLSRTTPRQGRYAKLFVAIMVYVIYNNLLGVANTWVEDAKISSIIGVWWVHACMLVGIWILLSKQYGALWVFNAILGRKLTN